MVTAVQMSPLVGEHLLQHRLLQIVGHVNTGTEQTENKGRGHTVTLPDIVTQTHRIQYAGTHTQHAH